MFDAITPTFLEGCGLAGTVSLVFVGQLRLCYVCLRLGSRVCVCFVLFCVFLLCCWLKQQKHRSFTPCEAMDVDLNFSTSGALWTWSTCPAITTSTYQIAF